MISQLTVFLENREGALAEATRALANANINMRSLNIADTSDFGILRIICDNPQEAAEALEKTGHRAVLTPVVAVKVPNVSGGLADVLEVLDNKDVNIEYGYCYAVNGEYAIDILKVRDKSAEVYIQAAGFSVLDAADVYEA